MEKVKIAELKSSLSAIVDKVRAGVRVVIYDRNTPVATLVGIYDPDNDPGTSLDNERLKHLQRIGILQLGKQKLLNSLSAPSVKIKTDRDLLSALEADREE